MSPFKCCLCFRRSSKFPEYFKTVLSDFIKLFNKIESINGLEIIKVDKLAMCKSCWICVMQVHQFDHELRFQKESCDAQKMFLSSKIRRAQKSLAQSGSKLGSCKEFEVESSLCKDNEDNEEDLEITATTQVAENRPQAGNEENNDIMSNLSVADEGNPQCSPQSPCSMSQTNTEDSDEESIALHEITDVITPTSDSLSIIAASSADEEPAEAPSGVTSESSDSEPQSDQSNQDPMEVIPVGTSDSGSDSESEPDKTQPAICRSKRPLKNKKWSSGWRIRSSNVKQLTESDFTYLNKYPFQKTDVGFQCGLCSASCNFCSGSSRIQYNILKHIHRWHISNDRVRSNKIQQRFLEIAPNRFQYGKYKVELIDGNYRCEECGEFSAAKTGRKKAVNIMEHIRRHHENPGRSFVCEHCGNVYSSSFALSVHKTTKHEKQDGQFPCSECGKTFPSRIRTLVHQKQVHGVKRKFICELCGKECSTKQNLANHIAFVHNGAKFECNDCDKIFGSKMALNIHRHCHLGTKFACDICGMDFSQQSSITRHKKTAHPQ